MGAISPDNPSVGGLGSSLNPTTSRLPSQSTSASTGASTVSVSQATTGTPIGISFLSTPQLDAPKQFISSWVPLMLSTIDENALQGVLGLLADADVSTAFSRGILAFHEFYDLGEVVANYYDSMDGVIDSNITIEQENAAVEQQRLDNIEYNNNVAIPQNALVDAYESCLAAPPPEGCGEDPGPRIELRDENVGEIQDLEELPDFTTYQAPQPPGIYEQRAQIDILGDLGEMLRTYFGNSDPDAVNSDAVGDDAIQIGFERFQGAFLLLTRSIEEMSEGGQSASGVGTLLLGRALAQSSLGLMDAILFNAVLSDFEQAILEGFSGEGEIALGTTLQEALQQAAQEGEADAVTSTAAAVDGDGDGEAGTGANTEGEGAVAPVAGDGEAATATGTGGTTDAGQTTADAARASASIDAVVEAPPTPRDLTALQVDAANALQDFLRDDTRAREALAADLSLLLASAFGFATIGAIAEIEEQRVGEAITENLVDEILIQDTVRNIIAQATARESIAALARNRLESIEELARLEDEQRELVQEGLELVIAGAELRVAEFLLELAGLRNPTNEEIGGLQLEVRDLFVEINDDLDERALDEVVESFGRFTELNTSMETYLLELIQPHRMNVLNLHSAFLQKPEGYYSDNPV